MTCISDKSDFSIEDVCQLLEQPPSSLFERAYDIKKRNVGTDVFLRGIIEISNILQQRLFVLRNKKKQSRFYPF